MQTKLSRPRSAIGSGDSQWSEIEHATFLKGYVQPAKCPSKGRLGYYGAGTCRVTRSVNFHGYWVTARPPTFSWNEFYSAYRTSKPSVYCLTWRVVWRLYRFDSPERRDAEPEPERSPGTGAEGCPQSRSRSKFSRLCSPDLSHLKTHKLCRRVLGYVGWQCLFWGPSQTTQTRAPRIRGPKEVRPPLDEILATPLLIERGYWCLLCSWCLIMLVKGYLGSRPTLLVSFEPYDNVIQWSKIHLKTGYQKYIRTYVWTEPVYKCVIFPVLSH